MQMQAEENPKEMLIECDRCGRMTGNYVETEDSNFICMKCNMEVEARYNDYAY